MTFQQTGQIFLVTGNRDHHPQDAHTQTSQSEVRIGVFGTQFNSRVESGFVPGYQNSYETEPVTVLGSTSGTPGYPEAAWELFCSSPAQSLLTKHSRLRAELDRFDFSSCTTGSSCHPHPRPLDTCQKESPLGPGRKMAEAPLWAPEKELIHLVCGSLNLGRRRLFARKPLIASLLTQSPVFQGTEGEGGREDLHSRNQH